MYVQQASPTSPDSRLDDSLSKIYARAIERVQEAEAQEADKAIPPPSTLQANGEGMDPTSEVHVNGFSSADTQF